MQSFSAFGWDNTEIAAYQWFQRFGLMFRSDTKLIDPSFWVVQESLISNCHTKFQRFWFAAILRSLLISGSGDLGSYSGWIRNWSSQLLHSPRESNSKPHCKVSALLIAKIPRSPLISGSGDSGSDFTTESKIQICLKLGIKKGPTATSVQSTTFLGWCFSGGKFGDTFLTRFFRNSADSRYCRGFRRYQQNAFRRIW